jgi:cyclic-di-GMP-binding protein
MNMASSPLSISDLHSGANYLSQLPLANPPLAEAQLLQFLDALLDNPPEAGILLALLEQARVPIHFVEEEMARRYHNKPLLLTEEEDRIFQQVLATWKRMSKAYALCARLQEPMPDNPQYPTLVATILHRCLYYTGMIILEHYRARREIPAGIWHELHGYYETAEQWGIIYTPVNDSLENDLQATHCAAAYVTLLLIEVASPYSNSVRNLNLIRRWAGMWAPLVSLHRIDDEYEVPPYIIELMKDQPIHPTNAADNVGADARRLDTARLGLQLSHMLAQLHQRMTPSQLGLGEETAGHVIQLLEQISRPWTQTASPRRFRRFASEGTARVAVGFDAMHYFIGGAELVQPDSASTYSRAEFDTLFTFRDQATPGHALSIQPRRDFPIDQWTVINHSANGFRLGRSHPGERIAHSQLLALCPHDGERFLLGQASWLMQEGSGALVVGVSILPGMPEAVGVRHAPSSAAHADRYARGFLLPAIAAIHQEGSIVIPSGMYQASGSLEVYANEKSVLLRMKHIRQRGVDFDRVSYEPL